MLIKYINTKITSKAMDVCRYRETLTWENIKTILKGAFGQPLSPQTLQKGLNFLLVRNDEDIILSYNNLVEELYYNVCNATVANKPIEEAKFLGSH